MTVKSLVLRSLSASRGNLSLLATASTPPWTPTPTTLTPSHRGGFLAIHANFLLKDLRYNIHSNILIIGNNKKQHRLLGSSFCEVYYSSDGTKDAKNEEIKNQEEVVKCPHCDMGFMSEEALSHHIGLTGKKGGRGCEVLWRERNEADVKAGKLKHVCDECGIGFKWKSDLDKHKAVHREKDLSDLKEDWEEEGVICPHCDIGFANAEALQTHLDSTGGPGHAGCRALWKKWNEEDVKAGKLRHVCDHDGCGIGFERKSNLDKHKAGHSDERPHRCKECGKSYKLQKTLKQHVREKHSGQVFECPECEKQFNSKGEIKKHLKICRQEEKEFKCSQCGLKFHANSDLTRHIKMIHNQDRPHKCELCDYSCSTKGNLKQHMRTVHENARPHQCEDCDAAFSTTDSLNKHRITHHTFDWPHTCHVCEVRGIKKGFIIPSKLKKHMEAQHPVEYQEQLEREKPAVCPQCGKRFKNEKQVDIHVKKMHN